MKRTNYEAPHYTIFSNLLPLPPFLGPKYSQHFVLKGPFNLISSLSVTDLNLA